MESYIKAIDYYLPEKVLTNDELAQIFPDVHIENFLNKIGIKQRHIAADDETATDMAIKAAERLFINNNDVARNEIDFILFCTQSAEYKLPSSACLIQKRLEIPTTTGALDIDQGCSGYIYGLALAKGLITAGIAKNVLFLTAETYSKYIHPADKGNRAIFGDGATATLISTEGFARIGEFVLGTDGNGANDLIVRTGGAHLPHASDNETDSWLQMKGDKIFTFSLKTVPELINETLEKNKTLQNEVDVYVLHQANKFMLDSLRLKMCISEDKFFTNYEKIGNTVSNSIPIALKDLVNQNRINKGVITLAGFGVGLSWGATEIFL